ncbi:anti-sigma regulatory factor (Ser/Thr protein kinase)/serine/threonine protein phosphatase PrpC [Crossiella equi]|uniref:Anti-sigma regulatory factor (Ser/Thr protein kinase)/serine/threonine protein phosphatase PrpC n=1 Tax=Crossiella equi TaxID=130796 RepID=A0ABS5AUX5_9PSEU|nr:SpoIIE family protein phosphatase [Crossiella equi]MBP2479515.1 anti-sigma regulatory factor (Ser/Thr protein kinase)/serine/threonine protein phosphatase PrpC [Crossiella equi]
MAAVNGIRLPVAEDVAWLPVEEAAHVGRVRREATALAQRLGFAAARAAEVGLAATEIGTNLHKHARQGAVLLRVSRDGLVSPVLEVLAVDRGPGIGDLDLAQRDGHTTTGTLGLGLGSLARLANSRAISSRPGRGTLLLTRFLARTGQPPDSVTEVAAGLTRPIGTEEVCGDAYAICHAPDRLVLMMCDGSGHGPLAASASGTAVRVFQEQPLLGPEEAVARVHQALRGTRGGAVAVADIDLAARSVRFAGLGNIAATVVAGDRKQGMVSVPGVAGYQARTIRSFTHPLPGRATVVLHSDGLTERWEAEQVVDLVGEPPLVIAAGLLREAGVRNDDASVVVAKTWQP